MNRSIIPLIDKTVKIDEKSDQNIFSPPSTVSSQQLVQEATTCSPAHQERLINELVDKIFDAKRGIYEPSSSYCSSRSHPPSEYSSDNRLTKWRGVIKDRQSLAKTIGQKTGKKKVDVLFNRPVTVDDRNKSTVKRVIDYADRMLPERLTKLVPVNLREKCQQETCQIVPEVSETLPKPERLGGTMVEITGIPKVSQVEQIGEPIDNEAEHMKHNRYFNSKFLQQRICDKREDIERVVEFYPDIENLQIVGQNLTNITSLKRNPKVLIEYEDIPLISTDTQSSIECILEEKVDVVEEPMPDYCLLINDEKFTGNEKRSSKHAEHEVSFVCEPFDYVLRRIMRIQNIGKKLISFQFHETSYFDKSPQLLKTHDDEFCFDHSQFRLLSGEFHDIIIQYQPRRVGVFKEKWLLRSDMQLFCHKCDAITIMLSGKCKPSPEYVDHIDGILKSVLYKSNVHMMRALTNKISTLTPLLKPHEVICPYKRALTEKEVFEMQNVGYKCDRFHDLELLKAIYKRVKKPREAGWDLNLETLKKKILCYEPAGTRAFIFSEMLAILEDMKISHVGGAKPEDVDVIEPANEERERAKFVFVRGILTTGIDEWEANVLKIEEAFLQSMEKDYVEKLEQKYMKSMAGGEGRTSLRQSFTSENGQKRSTQGSKQTSRRTNSKRGEQSVISHATIMTTLTAELKHRKCFRDTLYMQTYSHLCDVMENIVSIIESTEIV